MSLYNVLFAIALIDMRQVVEDLARRCGAPSDLPDNHPNQKTTEAAQHDYDSCLRIEVLAANPQAHAATA